MQHWLMKSEPDDYSIDDLKRDGTTSWDGVRNYQARNHMLEMEVGDRVLFYHSRLRPPGVIGEARVVSEAYPDHTSWDITSRYHDPKSTPEEPRWHMVDISYVGTFGRMVTIDELREVPDLSEMPLLNNSRLSVQPLTADQYELIVDLGRTPVA